MGVAGELRVVLLHIPRPGTLNPKPYVSGAVRLSTADLGSGFAWSDRLQV